MGPRIAILHHRRSFFPSELFQQVGDAAELVWVLGDDAETEPNAKRLMQRTGDVIETSGLDEDEVVDVLGHAHIDGIVTFVDDHLERAASIAERLGLVYHSPHVAEVMSDKRLQRIALDRAGIPGPRYWTVSNAPTLTELSAIAESARFPVVLKPARGSGSKGIVTLTGKGEVLALATAETSTGWIIEEYLEDDPEQDQRFASYLSLESVVSDGSITHVAVTGRFPLAEPFRETGNFIPGTVRPELDSTLREMVSGAIEALQMTDAVIHAEIKLTPDGPKMIEVNGRLGGRPPFVLLSVSDVNLFRTAVDVAVRRPISIETPVHCTAIGFWLMIQPPTFAQTVSGVDGMRELSTIAGVDVVDLRRHPGESVDWRDGTDSAVMTVRGRVRSYKQLTDTIEFIRHKVTFHYDA